MRPTVWRRGIFCLSVLLFLSLAAHANLPDSFGQWRTKSFLPIPASMVDRFAGGDALVLHEYGFVSGQRREYARDDASLTATLWQMRDATGSYGVFTFLQQRGMAPVNADEDVLFGGGRLLARRGVYVLDVRGEGLTDGDAPMLLNEIPSPRRGEDVLPQLPAYLPEENLIASTAKFLMGPAAFEKSSVPVPAPLIGFDLGAEAALAEYQFGRSTTRLLLVSYATPQLAAKQLRAFEESLKDLYVRRKGSLLAFVFGAPRETDAENLINAIRYESVITWNEYVPGPRDNVGDLLLAAFLLTGFVLLVTLVAGISFGGLRFLAKRFLPWEVFDRPAQMEIIRLNLSDR
jgi:hypothetical protein